MGIIFPKGDNLILDKNNEKYFCYEKICIVFVHDGGYTWLQQL